MSLRALETSSIHQGIPFLLQEHVCVQHCLPLTEPEQNAGDGWEPEGASNSATQSMATWPCCCQKTLTQPYQRACLETHHFQ